MNQELKQDLDHFFRVFLHNAKYDMALYLKPDAQSIKYKKEFEAEVEALRVSILKRIEEEYRK